VAGGAGGEEAPAPPPLLRGAGWEVAPIFARRSLMSSMAPLCLTHVESRIPMCVCLCVRVYMCVRSTRLRSAGRRREQKRERYS
jgi:hypothetical protein